MAKGTSAIARLEALRVPLVVQGPGTEELNLGGGWSEMDIAPTVLALLDISSKTSAEGEVLPVREGGILRVAGAPAGVELWGQGTCLANASGDDEYIFRGLGWGEYTLKAGGRSWDVLVDGDDTIDLAEKTTMPVDIRRALGVIMILIINLAGTVTIMRIWRRSE